MNATPGATGSPDEPGTLDDDGANREDDDLLAELRSLSARVDPPPADLSAVSRSLLAWHDPEAELATLVADSRELAGAVRGDTDVVLHFRAAMAASGVAEPGVAEPGVAEPGVAEPGVAASGAARSEVAIVVQISPVGDGLHRLVGQIEPVRAGRLELCRPTGESEVEVDELGRFVADRLPPGPMSLRWSPSRGVVVGTAWHRL